MTDHFYSNIYNWLDRVTERAAMLAATRSYWMIKSEEQSARHLLKDALGQDAVFMGPSETIACKDTLAEAIHDIIAIAEDFLTPTEGQQENSARSTTEDGGREALFLDALKSLAVFQWRLTNGIGEIMPRFFEMDAEYEEALSKLASRLTSQAPLPVLCGHVRFCSLENNAQKQTADYIARLLTGNKSLHNAEAESKRFWEAKPRSLVLGRKVSKPGENVASFDIKSNFKDLLGSAKIAIMIASPGQRPSKKSKVEEKSSQQYKNVKPNSDEGEFCYEMLLERLDKVSGKSLDSLDLGYLLTTSLKALSTGGEADFKNGEIVKDKQWSTVWTLTRNAYVLAKNGIQSLPIWLKVLGPILNAPDYLLKKSASVAPLRHIHRTLRMTVSAEGQPKVEALSRLCFAALVVALLYELTLTGRLTGLGPADQPARRRLLGNTWNAGFISAGSALHEFGDIGHFTKLIASLAEVIETLEEEKAQSLSALAVLTLYDILEGEESCTALFSIISNAVSGNAQTLPTVKADALSGSAIESLIVLGNAVLGARASVAGFSTQATTRRNSFGSPVFPDVPQRSLGLDPETDPLESHIDQELERFGVTIAPPSKVQDGAVLSEPQHQELSKFFGNTVKDRASGSSMKEALLETSQAVASAQVEDPSSMYRMVAKEYRDNAKQAMNL